MDFPILRFLHSILNWIEQQLDKHQQIHHYWVLVLVLVRILLHKMIVSILQMDFLHIQKKKKMMNPMKMELPKMLVVEYMHHVSHHVLPMKVVDPMILMGLMKLIHIVFVRNHLIQEQEQEQELEMEMVLVLELVLVLVEGQVEELKVVQQMELFSQEVEVDSMIEMEEVIPILMVIQIHSYFLILLPMNLLEVIPMSFLMFPMNLQMKKIQQQ